MVESSEEPQEGAGPTPVPNWLAEAAAKSAAIDAERAKTKQPTHIGDMIPEWISQLAQAAGESTDEIRVDDDEIEIIEEHQSTQTVESLPGWLVEKVDFTTPNPHSS